MDIFLLDRNGGLVDLWQQYFSEDNVMPVRGFFDVFMDPYDVQCVVSPANSYGMAATMAPLLAISEMGSNDAFRITLLITTMANSL